MKHIFCIIAFGLLFALGCEEKNVVVADQQIPLNGAFLLAPPQKGVSEDVTLEILEIDDSRCPSDVQCISGGEVSVKIKIMSSGAAKEVVLTLNNSALDGKNTKEVGSYRITLEWVSGPPGWKEKWKLNDYEVRLSVSQV